jgi:hypothetical protein
MDPGRDLTGWPTERLAIAREKPVSAMTAVETKREETRPEKRRRRLGGIDPSMVKGRLEVNVNVYCKHLQDFAGLKSSLLQ